MVAMVWWMPQGIADDTHKALQIREIVPTGIFPRPEPHGILHQIADLHLHNNGAVTTVTATIALAGRPVVTERLGEVPSGASVKQIRVPDVEHPEDLTVTISAGGDQVLLDRCTVRWQPQRKWVIYHVAVSHHDLGYADYYHMMRRDVREWGIERALQFCRDTDDWDDESRYRWTVETSEPLIDFLQYQDTATREQLVRRIQEGRIELGAIHNSASTEGMSYEALARLFYTPNRHVVDFLGIEPRKTALLNDVVGLTRSLPLYSKEADIPYFYHGRNQLQDQLQPASAHPVYYWMAPDGDRARMTLFRTQHYHLRPNEFGQDLASLSERDVRTLIAQYDARQDWTPDVILCADSWDFSIPELGKVTQIRDWNRRYAFPKFICATMTMFFDAMAAQTDPAEVFVFDRDAPNTWIDQDYSDAEAAGWARRLGYDLPTVEKCATLAMLQGDAGYPWEDIWQAYHRLLMYHEHTNAAYAEGPIYAPPSLLDESAANALYYETEIEMHRRLAQEAQAFAARARLLAEDRLEKLIPCQADRTVVVFNPLNWSRTDLVRLEGVELAESAALTDESTGAEVPWQRMHDGTVVFVSENVPSLGYKTYSIATRAAEAPPMTDELSAHDSTLENAFYRVEFDPKTGAICSLFDKELGTELVDQEAPYQLNEYLYHRVDGDKAAWHRVESATLDPVVGPVAAVMNARVDGAGAHSIQQQVILYRNLKRLDFLQTIEKASCGRTLADYRTSDPARANHAKEAVFYALPLAVPQFQIKHELAGAVVEPVADQAIGSSTDYYSIQHFSDMSNQRYGVTLATLDCGLIQYDHPRPSQSWVGESVLERPLRSHAFLYLMNNWFGTNIRIDQPGRKTFAWSIRSHLGNWKQGQAYTFGWETSHPFVARLISGPQTGTLPAGECSFVQVDRPNVVLTTMKPAEANGEGYILRFHEVAGEAVDVTVALPLLTAISSATETSLIEVDRPKAPTLVATNQFKFSIAAHGVKTIRVRADSRPPRLDQVVAKPVSDMEVELSWTPVPDGSAELSHYDVYRGETPGFAVGLSSWVGRSTEAVFLDQPRLNHGGWRDNRLEPGTTYYYRVRPVDRGNNFGQVSQEVRVTTRESREANRSPAVVEGLYAVHVSPVSPHDYVALWWYTNCESDITHYRIYRGDDVLLTEVDAASLFTHTTPHGFGTVTRELREYNRILYVDQDVVPGRTYCYRVQAVDRWGTAGEPSSPVAVATP